MLFFADAFPGIVTFCCIPHGSSIVTVATARALAEFTLRESAWGGGVQLVLNLQMAVVSVNTYSSVFLTFLQKALRSVKKGRPRPQCLEFTEGYAICKKKLAPSPVSAHKAGSLPEFTVGGPHAPEGQEKFTSSESVSCPPRGI